MANEVKIVVTGQNRSKSALDAPKKELDELGKAAEKASVTAEKALKNLESSANEAFDKLSAKMNNSFDRMGLKSKQAFDTKEVDRFKSSMDKMHFDIDFGSKGIGEKLLTGLTKASMMAGDWAKTGGQFAESMWSGFSSTVNNGLPPEAKAGIIAAGLTAAAAVGPLVGGALGGAVVGGFGAAIGGIAIVSAAQSNKVHAAFSGMADHIVSDTQEWTGGVESMLVRFAGRAATTFDNIGPKFRSAIAAITPGLESLGDGLLKSLERFAPAFEPLAKAATAVFEDVGKRLPGVMGELSDEFSELAEEIERNPKALGDFISAVGEGIEIVVDFVGFLNRLWEVHKQLFDALTTPLEWVGLKDGATQADLTGAALTRVADFSYDAATATEGLDKAFQDLAEAEDDAAKRGQAMLDVLNIIAGRAPTYEESVQSVNDTIRGLLEDFTKTGAAAHGFGDALINTDGTINTTTENGSKLRDAITGLQGDFTNMAGATKELERAGLSHEEAVSRVNAQMLVQRDRLLDNAAKMGLTRDQMQRLLDTYGLTPKDLETIARLDDKDARAKADELTRTRTMSVWVTYYASNSVGSNGGIVGGGSNKMFAHGGVSSGGWTTVGELGPERVMLPPGAQVMPSTRSQPLMDSQGSPSGGMGGAVAVEWLGGPPGELERALYNWMKGRVRIRGASSAVLG